MNLTVGEIHFCGMPEPDILEMNTVLYQGFGGYTVRKNGELFYEGNSDDEWNKFKKLRHIEKEAKKDPTAKWTVELYEPLSGATWERQEDGQWVAIEKNLGFA